jgi:hypothetical protein
MTNSNDNKNEYIPPIRELPIYIILVCGAVIFLTGVGMYFLKINANGNKIADGYDRFLQEHMIMNGPGAMLLGYIIFIIPFYILRKQFLERKKFDNNIF